MTLVLSAVGLTYEIAAGRVLAPYFGTSLSTWTAVIATVLGGFSLGSALGGLVAERPRALAFRNMRCAVVCTAALMAASPVLLVVMHEILAGGTIAMLVTVFIVFFPASVFVTLPTPFLTKLAIEARPGRQGSSLGLVMAAGSIGAIFGSIIAGFVTLPFVGSVATFAICGAATLLCLPFLKHSGLGANHEDRPGYVTPSLAAGFIGWTALSGFSVCEFESGLSCLHVVKAGTATVLVSDGVTQAAEPSGDVVDRTGDPQLSLPYTQWVWARMDRDLGPDARVLFIGGGGYSLPSAFLRAQPLAEAVVVEIDPLITRVVMENLPRAAAVIDAEGYDTARADEKQSGRMAIIHADGRVFLNETDMRFDAVVMDAFSSNSVPAHLVTRETFQRLADVVRGPVYVNLIDVSDGPLARGVFAILNEIYPHVEVVQSSLDEQGRGNILLAASTVGFLPMSALPDGYVRAHISPDRAFTDDRSWSGLR